MDLLDLLLDHDQWATRRLLDASAGLTDAQWGQPFDIGHRSLRATFAHIIFNVPFWTAIMTRGTADGEYSTDNPPDDLSLAALIEHHERTFADFAAAARRLRDADRLAQTFVDHYDVRKSFGGTILMVIEHDAEHRTEVLHILERLGVPNLPEVDLGVWDYRLHNT